MALVPNPFRGSLLRLPVPGVVAMSKDRRLLECSSRPSAERSPWSRSQPMESVLITGTVTGPGNPMDWIVATGTTAAIQQKGAP